MGKKSKKGQHHDPEHIHHKAGQGTHHHHKLHSGPIHNKYNHHIHHHKSAQLQPGQLHDSNQPQRSETRDDATVRAESDVNHDETTTAQEQSNATSPKTELPVTESPPSFRVAAAIQKHHQPKRLNRSDLKKLSPYLKKGGSQSSPEKTDAGHPSTIGGLSYFQARYDRWKSSPRKRVVPLLVRQQQSRSTSTSEAAVAKPIPAKEPLPPSIGKSPQPGAKLDVPRTVDTKKNLTAAFASTTAPAPNFDDAAGSHVRQKLVEFYTKYNPSKIDSVDKTLETFDGRYDEMFDKLQKKYQYPIPSGEGPVCFLEFSGNQRIIIQLYSSLAPKAAENFRALCTGDVSIGGKKLTYQFSKIHRIVPGMCIQGGDYTVGNGTGGRSIYQPPEADMWGNFKDETMSAHNEAGLLSMANKGPNTNSSQFFITTAPAAHLNGKHVVFGKVLKGLDVVLALEKKPADAKQRPMEPIAIENCGELNKHAPSSGESAFVANKSLAGTSTISAPAQKQSASFDDSSSLGVSSLNFSSAFNAVEHPPAKSQNSPTSTKSSGVDFAQPHSVPSTSVSAHRQEIQAKAATNATSLSTPVTDDRDGSTSVDKPAQRTTGAALMQPLYSTKIVFKSLPSTQPVNVLKTNLRTNLNAGHRLRIEEEKPFVLSFRSGEGNASIFSDATEATRATTMGDMKHFKARYAKWKSSPQEQTKTQSTLLDQVTSGDIPAEQALPNPTTAASKDEATKDKRKPANVEIHLPSFSPPAEASGGKVEASKNGKPSKDPQVSLQALGVPVPLETAATEAKSKPITSFAKPGASLLRKQESQQDGYDAEKKVSTPTPSFGSGTSPAFGFSSQKSSFATMAEAPSSSLGANSAASPFNIFAKPGEQPAASMAKPLFGVVKEKPAQPTEDKLATESPELKKLGQKEPSTQGVHFTFGSPPTKLPTNSGLSFGAPATSTNQTASNKSGFSFGAAETRATKGLGFTFASSLGNNEKSEDESAEANRAAAAFDHLDDRKLKKLPTSKMEDLLKELGEGFRGDELQKQIALIDKKNSGFLERAAFVEWYQELSSSALSSDSEDEISLDSDEEDEWAEQVELVQAIFDEKGTGGGVTLEESKFEDLIEALGTVYCEDKGSAHTRAKKKLTKKGLISIDDFLSWYKNCLFGEDESSVSVGEVSVDDDNDGRGQDYRSTVVTLISVQGSNETPSASKPPSSKWSSTFAIEEGMWKCEVCSVQNNASATSCAACETSRPGSKSAGETSKPPSSKWISTFAIEDDSWKCEVCSVRNSTSATSCAACETPHPGSKSAGEASKGANKDTSASSIGSPGFASGAASFKFGFAQGKNDIAVSTSAAAELVTAVPKSSSPYPSTASKALSTAGDVSGLSAASKAPQTFGAASGTSKKTAAASECPPTASKAPTPFSTLSDGSNPLTAALKSSSTYSPTASKEIAAAAALAHQPTASKAPTPFSTPSAASEPGGNAKLKRMFDFSNPISSATLLKTTDNPNAVTKDNVEENKQEIKELVSKRSTMSVTQEITEAQEPEDSTPPLQSADNQSQVETQVKEPEFIEHEQSSEVPKPSPRKPGFVFGSSHPFVFGEGETNAAPAPQSNPFKQPEPNPFSSQTKVGSIPGHNPFARGPKFVFGGTSESSSTATDSNKSSSVGIECRETRVDNVVVVAPMLAQAVSARQEQNVSVSGQRKELSTCVPNASNPFETGSPKPPNPLENTKSGAYNPFSLGPKFVFGSVGPSREEEKSCSARKGCTEDRASQAKQPATLRKQSASYKDPKSEPKREATPPDSADISLMLEHGDKVSLEQPAVDVLGVKLKSSSTPKLNRSIQTPDHFHRMMSIKSSAYFLYRDPIVVSICTLLSENEVDQEHKAFEELTSDSFCGPDSNSSRHSEGSFSTNKS